MKKRLASQGVRSLKVQDQLPDCEILINASAFDLRELSPRRLVLDVGCGYGRSQRIVEGAGGTWFGLERFPGTSESVRGDAEMLPIKESSVDVVLMDAVLEHVPDASLAFAEVSRVLRPKGYFIGYVAFMECFHEISYSHLSFKALEYFAWKNGMKLIRVAGGGAFGIDYHMQVLLYPLPTVMLRRVLASSIRMFIRTKAALAALLIRSRRHLSRAEAIRLREDYYQLECLRQSNGFTFLIQKV